MTKSLSDSPDTALAYSVLLVVQTFSGLSSSNPRGFSVIEVLIAMERFARTSPEHPPARLVLAMMLASKILTLDGTMVRPGPEFAALVPMAQAVFLGPIEGVVPALDAASKLEIN